MTGLAWRGVEFGQPGPTVTPIAPPVAIQPAGLGFLLSGGKSDGTLLGQSAEMKILVTGSAGHLDEALMRTLRNTSHDIVGLDMVPSEFTGVVGSITERGLVRRCMAGVEAVFHTATLHKPHVQTL